MGGWETYCCLLWPRNIVIGGRLVEWLLDCAVLMKKRSGAKRVVEIGI